MKPDINDFLILIGLVCIGVGLWFIFPASLLFLFGVIFIFLGWPRGDK